ncbi:MAG: glycoside hydrolase family 2 TIM barrel-domain containing protein [Eubacteriales bacterium]|nr:glycoside hydrolase family 2 TIM barrel-domain containing protein [Eubacteriales bacterium]
MRQVVNLRDGWVFIKQAGSYDEAIHAAGEKISLPHTWNAIDGQDGGNDYHRGTCWYRYEFPKPDLKKDERIFIEFMGAAMTAEVFLNGKSLTVHEGGYSTFRVELTKHILPDNILVVAVDNSANNRVYPQLADFTFYGGLYRDVNLIIVPQTHFSLNRSGGPALQITPVIEGDDAMVTIDLWLTGGDSEVTISIDNYKQTVKTENGHAQTMIIISNVRRWDGIDDPFLYTATARTSDDSVSARFGCRSFSVDSQSGFILNGRSYPLRGVSRHQDHAGVGNAVTQEMHETDMELIRDIGANSIRLAHYQHAQAFYDLCDEQGIIVWAEIPYITSHMSNGRENAMSQMKELVIQNYNHPSIVCWGLSNEITAATQVNDELIASHRDLNELCHVLDSTRPTTMANVFMLETDSEMLEIADINSYNLYFGWYLGTLEQNDEFFDDYHNKYPERCMGFSEYGADANPQYQSSKPERGDYTESYQAIYHEHMLQMIEQRPWLWSTYVWNMFDFAADGRDEGGKNGLNQKGLVTIDRKLCKDAYYLYKAYWSQQPFVHICGRRYINRAEEVTEVKVYSNQTEVELFVDGKPFASLTGTKIFRFNVPISGKHTISAKSQQLSDEISLVKCEEPDKSYMFDQRGDIVNWFDRDTINPNFYSIEDTLADLREHPQAAMLIDQLMSGASASRGDVAESVKDNPNLQRMMGRMKLSAMLKHAGDSVSVEQLQTLNDMLQKIEKIKVES